MKGILQVFSSLFKVNNPQKVFRLLQKKFKIFPHIPVICLSIADDAKHSRRKAQAFVRNTETVCLVILPIPPWKNRGFFRHSNSFGRFPPVYSPAPAGKNRRPDVRTAVSLTSLLFSGTGPAPRRTPPGTPPAPWSHAPADRTPRSPASRGHPAGSARTGRRRPPPAAGPLRRSGPPPPRNSCGPGSWCGR